MDKKIISLKNFLNFFFYIFLFFLVFLPFWFKKKFGEVYLDQFIFHLELLLQGNLVGDAQVQESLYKWSIITSTLATTLYLFIKKKYLNNFNISKKKETIYFLIFVFLSLGYNTAFFKSLNFNENDFIDKNYVFNEPIKIENNKRNLVLIYVESLDNFFSDKEIFGDDLLRPLSVEISNGISIENFYQLPGYSFTINSLVSTQCGIPAKPLGFFKESDLKNIKNFLPNIKCLSDFTNDLDYINIFLTSDEIENFGVKYFLNNHNYLDKNIYDVKKLNKLGYETSKNAWRGTKNKYGGMHDDVLFEASLNIINEIKNNQKPFFLTVYTLDTHSPRGYPNQNCLKSKFSNINIINDFNIKHSVICTVDSLKQFILNLSNLDEEIDIIILGDHSYPQNFKTETSIYNKFVLREKKVFNRSKMNHLDLFPSLLSLLGYEFKDGRLGLGFNIFNSVDLIFYNEFITNLDKKISGKSKKYLSFWKND